MTQSVTRRAALLHTAQAAVVAATTGSLAGCAAAGAAVTTAVTVGTTAVQLGVAGAEKLYGTAKGIAQVAAAADPALAPAVDVLVGIGDPIMGAIQAGSNDLTQVEKLVNAATQLVVQTSQDVKVVSNKV